MDYIGTLLAATLPNDRTRFLHSINRVTSDHLAGNQQAQKLWDLCSVFFQKFGQLPTPVVVKDALAKNLDAGEAALVWQLYSVACGTTVTDGEFRYAVEGLIDREAKRKTGEVLAVAYEIFESGYENNGERLEGHAAMRQWLAPQLAEIERHGLIDAAPEGNMRTETDSILADYYARKNLETAPGVLTGIPSIDEVSGGMLPSDLVLVVAYTSQGKSQLAVDMAWNACIMQGKNVYYGTSETSRLDIINRFVARHSKLPKFNHAEGLDHSKIRRAQLTAAEEKILKDVLEDLHYTNYGVMEIQQLERGSTLDQLESRMLAKHHEFGIDVATCDYLNLLKPTSKRNTQREEASDILKDAKTLATSFGGTGIPFVSPWQVGRDAWKAAQVTQSYDLSALSESSEAEKSPDLVITILYDDKLSPNTAILGLPKNRNGRKIHKIDVTVDYSCSYFKENKSGGTAAVSYSAPAAQYTTGMASLSSY